MKTALTIIGLCCYAFATISNLFNFIPLAGVCAWAACFVIIPIGWRMHHKIITPPATSSTPGVQPVSGPPRATTEATAS